MLRRKDIKPGMKLRHRRTGSIGEARSSPGRPKELMDTDPLFVAVRVHTLTNRQVYHYPFWLLSNVERV